MRKNRISDLISGKLDPFVNLSTNPNRYVTKPYQFFGIYIARILDDFKNLPLYIKLAKEQDKNLLDAAISYIKDYPNPKSKRNLFLWYIKGKLKRKKLTSSGNKKIKQLNLFKYSAKRRIKR